MTPTEYRREINRRLRARLLVYHEPDDIEGGCVEQDAEEMRAEIEDEMEEELWGKP